MIYDNIQRHAGLFTEHTELRVQENRTTYITVVNGDVVGNTRESASGVSARVHFRGAWGFASVPATDDPSIARAVVTATANAWFLGTRRKGRSRGLPVSARSGVHDLGTGKPRRSHAELVDFVKGIDGYLADRHPDLVSRAITLWCLDMEKVLLTSEGAVACSMIPRSLLYVTLSRAAGTGDMVEEREVFGGRGQFEDVFDEPARLSGPLEELCGHLARKAEGVYPDAGPHEVILGPDLTGILAHEAIGHTVEGDLVLGGSVARENMGAPVASEHVTLVDFAHSALGEMCPVPLWIDDEGTGAEDVVLIDRGILRSFMHNKETAVKLDAPPTGNARAFAFSDEPLVRMRNTAILPGGRQLGELIGSVDNGYYLMKPGSGQADATGEFMFGVTRGCEIRDGKPGRALRDTSVSGVAFEMLKSVSMVSNDMHWSCGGMCGKKQLMPVGVGGPALKCTITIGGR